MITEALKVKCILTITDKYPDHTILQNVMVTEYVMFASDLEQQYDLMQHFPKINTAVICPFHLVPSGAVCLHRFVESEFELSKNL